MGFGLNGLVSLSDCNEGSIELISKLGLFAETELLYLCFRIGLGFQRHLAEIFPFLMGLEVCCRYIHYWILLVQIYCLAGIL